MQIGELDIGQLISDGLKSWIEVEQAKSQADIAIETAKAQAVNPYRSTASGGLIRNPLTGQYEYPRYEPNAPLPLDTSKLLLYIGIGAAGLLLFTALRK